MHDGHIEPAKRGQESGLVSFEVYMGNNVLVNLIRAGKDEFREKELLGIFVDESDLEREGFQIFRTDSRTHEARLENKHTSKYENITSFGQETEAYKSIGEYIHVKGCIPIKYFKKIEQYG